MQGKNFDAQYSTIMSGGTTGFWKPPLQLSTVFTQVSNDWNYFKARNYADNINIISIFTIIYKKYSSR